MKDLTTWQPPSALRTESKILDRDSRPWRKAAGPWDGEPDKKQWTDEATGLPCLIVRGPAGAWCGYVGVSKGHPCFQVDFQDQGMDFDVHWGLTYSSGCSGHICHEVAEGEDDDVWWLGFDCNHGGDMSPSGYSIGFAAGVYRDVAFVTAEVTRLAAQLHAVKS